MTGITAGDHLPKLAANNIEVEDENHQPRFRAGANNHTGGLIKIVI
ncbi:hypothetical protein IIC38_06365 [candidate division KSB1 bacterium]|nr:hypothetical protein [candidate division KSB1 bacterium]